MTSKKILVLGGGYSGLMAGLRLAGKTKGLGVSVMLINGIEHFVERPSLHELATGRRLPEWSIGELLGGTRAAFLQGWVTGIEPNQQWVEVETVEERQRLRYDYLIYALGSRMDRSTIAGVDEHAFRLDFHGPLNAKALRAKLVSYGEQPFKVAVVGGGATGLEVATQIKAKYAQSEVSIISNGQVGAFKGSEVEKHIKEALAEQSILLHEHCQVTSVAADGVWVGRERIEANVVVWAAGFLASPLARQAGIRVNQRDQVMVDPYLRSLSHPNIYAAGDAAYPVEEPGSPMRMAIFPALVSGAQAADNIVAELKGKPLQPLSFAWYGQAIALGPHDAVGFSTYPADLAALPIFRRGLAVRVRAFFVWLLLVFLKIEKNIPGFFFWLGKKRYRQRKKSDDARQGVEQGFAEIKG